MPGAQRQRASDWACASNSPKVVTRSSSTMAELPGAAVALCSSHSCSSSLSGSSKRHPPGEANARRREQKQLTGTNMSITAHLSVVDNQIAGKGVAKLCHACGRQAVLGQPHHSAEALAIAAADVGVDEMIHIAQTQPSIRQDFVGQPKEMEIEDGHDLVFDHDRIDGKLDFPIDPSESDGIMQMAERQGLNT